MSLLNHPLCVLWLCFCANPLPAPPSRDAEALAERYAAAIRKLNEEHRQKPVQSEAELAQRLPAAAQRALEDLLEKPKPADAEALVLAAEAALELARVEDFNRLRVALALFDPARSAALGEVLSEPRFLLRGLNGLDQNYLRHFAQIFTLILEAYDEVFSFSELSKVPLKKLRVRVHLEEKIEKPPHFAPQFEFHSEIDFPVVDAQRLRSPTADGQFLFYGLCHELGHVIAMWGDRTNEEDHHAWAHYTGVAIVEHLSQKKGTEYLQDIRDEQWRSLKQERKRLQGTTPALTSRDGVLALLLRLHDELGPKAIAAAINAMDADDDVLRIQQVRYYNFRALRKALEAQVKGSAAKKFLTEMFG